MLPAKDSPTATEATANFSIARTDYDAVARAVLHTAYVFFGL